MFRVSVYLCLSISVFVNLSVHLHQRSSLFKISPTCLLVCLIYFNLSACQLICHFKDLSCSMLICLHASAYLPVNFNVFLKCSMLTMMPLLFTPLFTPSNFYIAVLSFPLFPSFTSTTCQTILSSVLHQPLILQNFVPHPFFTCF